MLITAESLIVSALVKLCVCGWCVFEVGLQCSKVAQFFCRFCAPKLGEFVGPNFPPREAQQNPRRKRMTVLHLQAMVFYRIKMVMKKRKKAMFADWFESVHSTDVTKIFKFSRLSPILMASNPYSPFLWLYCTNTLYVGAKFACSCSCSSINADVQGWWSGMAAVHQAQLKSEMDAYLDVSIYVRLYDSNCGGYISVHVIVIECSL